jgi:transcriptional regulator with XRE-family HTH domain
MFDMSEGVRYRTLPEAEDPREVSALNALRDLERAIAGGRDELESERPNAEGLGAACADAVRASRAVIRRTAVLPLSSPFRGGILSRAGESLLGLIEGSDGQASSLEPFPNLVNVLADVEHAAGRDVFAQALKAARGNLSLRALAERSHVSLGHLSDLERGKSGPPSERSARALGEALDGNLAVLAKSTRARVRSLREKARLLRSRGTLRSKVDTDSGRIGAIAVALASDRSLLEVTERFVLAPAALRRAIGDLIVTMQDGTESARRGSS